MRRVAVGSLLVLVLTAGGALPAVADAPTPVLTAPASLAVTGAERDGAVLTAHPERLSWGTTPETVTVQWQRDDVDVPGATGPRLRLGAASVGHRFRAVATATLAGASASVASPDAAVQPGATSERRLKAALRALEKKLPGRYTVQVRELDAGKRLVSIDAGAHREPASVFKLFVAYGVYTRIDHGTLRYTDRVSSGLTVRTCLKAMIEPSDNYCAQDLRTRIGTAWLNRLLHGHGLTGTTFWYDGHRTKTTTTADVTTLLARLARGQLVSKASTTAFLRQLETQVWREAIPPGLPDGVRQASKPGTLWTATGMVQTDSAIVWGPRSRYVLTVMGSNGATIHSITRIGETVYRELQGRLGKRFHYTHRQMRATGPIVLTSSVDRRSHVLGRYRSGALVEVVDSIRTRYLVRIAGRTGWIDNTHLTLRHKIL